MIKRAHAKPFFAQPSHPQSSLSPMTTFRPRVAKSRRLVTILIVFAVIFFFSYTQSAAFSRRHDLSASASASTNTDGDRRKTPSAPLPSNHSTRALVICRTTKEDISYYFQPHAQLPPMDPFVYITDDDNAPLRPPVRKGREAMVYLTYMIDHYDSLHDVNIFVHAHRYAWHNNDIMAHDMLSMVRQLSEASVKRKGFLNLRCNWYIGCPNWIHPDPQHYYRTPEERRWNKAVRPEEGHIGESWAELFPNDPLPETLSTPAGAQFALSREQIRSVPRERLIHIRNWLINTKLPDSISGRVMEYLWHYIFTKKDILCIPEHMCFCDTYGLCFGGEENYTAFTRLAADLKRQFDKKKDFETKTRVFAEAKTHKFVNESQRPAWLTPETKNRMDIEIAKNSAHAQSWIQDALQMGMSPRNRAIEARRPWKEGDGF